MLPSTRASITRLSEKDALDLILSITRKRAISPPPPKREVKSKSLPKESDKTSVASILSRLTSDQAAKLMEILNDKPE